MKKRCKKEITYNKRHLCMKTESVKYLLNAVI